MIYWISRIFRVSWISWICTISWISRISSSKFPGSPGFPGFPGFTGFPRYLGFQGSSARVSSSSRISYAILKSLTNICGNLAWCKGYLDENYQRFTLICCPVPVCLICPPKCPISFQNYKLGRLD